MGRGQPIHRMFIIMLVIFPISTYSQGGNREFIWLEPSLSSVLANAKVQT
jgi:hypothetical protein